MLDERERPRVGLALGGGVVRGMAHVGVLTALAEAGIPIDLVAGTSAGSIMGAFFCAGLESAEIEYIASRIGWRDVARPVWPKRGLVSFAVLEKTITNILGPLTFADLERPFASVCTDLYTGREVVIREGPLAPAVRASASVPGFVTPYERGDELLADGALVNNLPASVAREMGADYVIGVDVMAPDFKRGWGALGMGLTAVEIAVANSGAGRTHSDCFILPELGGLTYLLFSQRDTLIAHGKEAAAAAVPQIKRDLGL